MSIASRQAERVNAPHSAPVAGSGCISATRAGLTDRFLHSRRDPADTPEGTIGRRFGV
jgi:hypothetical protein